MYPSKFTKLLSICCNSALGALGPFGPLGDGSYSPADVMKSIGNWQEFKKLLGKDGPLDSPEGPMSVAGPLGDSFWTTMPYINDFAKHMMGGGLILLKIAFNAQYCLNLLFLYQKKHQDCGQFLVQLVLWEHLVHWVQSVQLVPTDTQFVIF